MGIDDEKITGLPEITDPDLLQYVVGVSGGITVKITQANLVSNFVHVRLTKAELPTDLTEGQLLGVVFVTDIDDGVLGYMNDLALWKNLDTGDSLLIPVDPSPSVFYTDTSPTAMASTENNLTTRRIELLFDTSTDVTGADTDNGWTGESSDDTNQRIAYTRPNPGTPLFKARSYNYHNNGAGNTVGIQNVKIYISSDIGDYNTNYGVLTGNMTLMFDGVITKQGSYG